MTNLIIKVIRFKKLKIPFLPYSKSLKTLEKAWKDKKED